MACEQITPGPVQGVGLFVVDECWNPVYGADAGYYDDCATPAEISPQTAETRPEFLKTCPNGDIRAYIPARTVTTTTETAYNFVWLPVEFLAAAGAVTPVVFNGETVGYSDCDEAINLIAIVWQELIGNDACGGGETGASSVVTVYALRDVRFAQTGTPGSSDFNYQVIGRSVRANIGSGPIPLFFDSGDDTEAAWPDDCIEVCAKGTVFKAYGPPTECGVIDTVEPAEPCVTAS